MPAIFMQASPFVCAPFGDRGATMRLPVKITFERVSRVSRMSRVPRVSRVILHRRRVFSALGLDSRRSCGTCRVIRYVPDVRCPAQSARAKYVLAYPWGAPRLRAAAFSSIPAFPPAPLSAGNHPRFANATAARARPNVLTLIPLRLACGFRLPIRSPAARSPRSTLPIAAASLLLALSLAMCAPLRSAHATPSDALCALRYAPRTPRKPPCVQVSDGRASRVPSSVQHTRF